MKLAVHRNLVQNMLAISLVATLLTSACASQNQSIRNMQVQTEGIVRETESMRRMRLERELNFRNHPGQHTVLSPVAGSRSDESDGLHELARREPSLISFARAIYYGERPSASGGVTIDPPVTNYMVRYQDRSAATIVAQRIFRNYISRYQKHGITEANIISWDNNYPDSGGITNLSNPTSQDSIWYVQTRCSARSFSDGVFFMPAYVTAFHEVMHVEEASVGASLVQRLNDLQGLPIVIDELMPQLATLILLDEVNKQVRGIPLGHVFEYTNYSNLSLVFLSGGVIQVYWDDQSAPLGKVVNFYRDLVARYGSYFAALKSGESLHFLHTGQFE